MADLQHLILLSRYCPIPVVGGLQRLQPFPPSGLLRLRSASPSRCR